MQNVSRRRGDNVTGLLALAYEQQLHVFSFLVSSNCVKSLLVARASCKQLLELSESEIFWKPFVEYSYAMSGSMCIRSHKQFYLQSKKMTAERGAQFDATTIFSEHPLRQLRTSNTRATGLEDIQVFAHIEGGVPGEHKLIAPFTNGNVELNSGFMSSEECDCYFCQGCDCPEPHADDCECGKCPSEDCDCCERCEGNWCVESAQTNCECEFIATVHLVNKKTNQFICVMDNERQSDFGTFSTGFRVEMPGGYKKYPDEPEDWDQREHLEPSFVLTWEHDYGKIHFYVEEQLLSGHPHQEECDPEAVWQMLCVPGWPAC
jgi:hypothetical protein